MVTRGDLGFGTVVATPRSCWAIASTDHAASIGWARVRASGATSAEKLRANLRPPARAAGATQLNPGTDPTCASTRRPLLILSSRRRARKRRRSNDLPIEEWVRTRAKSAANGCRARRPRPGTVRVAHSASRKITQHHDGPGLCTARERDRRTVRLLQSPGSRSAVRRISACVNNSTTSGLSSRYPDCRLPEWAVLRVRVSAPISS
jgi:hypothetical protein